MDWVGEAHNKGIDDYLRDKHGRKLLDHSVCKDVMDFYVHRAEVFPHDRDAPTREQRIKAGLAGLRATVCEPTAQAQSKFVPTSLIEARTMPTDLSSQAQGLLADIGSALDRAIGPEQLASDLNLVLDRAAVLSSDEADVVAGVASVTQSSFEYWTVNYPIVAPQIARELADEGCTASQLVCFSAFDRSAVPMPSVRFASANESAPSFGRCLGWENSPRDIAKADFTGAVMGAIMGGWATLGMSIIGGGLVASAVAILWNILVAIFCWLFVF